MYTMNQLLRVMKYMAAGMVAGTIGGCLLLLFGVPFLTTPFTGFTFTDPADFYPQGLILAVVPAVAVRHFVRPYPRWWNGFSTTAAFVTTLFAPLLGYASVLLVWLRAQSVPGPLPRSITDNPNDPLYQGVGYIDAYIGALLYVSFALTVHLLVSRQLSRRRLAELVAIFVVGWAIVFLDPFHLRV